MWATEDQSSTNLIKLPSPSETTKDLVHISIHSPSNTSITRNIADVTTRSTSSTASPEHSVDVSSSPSTTNSTNAFTPLIHPTLANSQCHTPLVATSLCTEPEAEMFTGILPLNERNGSEMTPIISTTKAFIRNFDIETTEANTTVIRRKYTTKNTPRLLTNVEQSIHSSNENDKFDSEVGSSRSRKQSIIRQRRAALTSKRHNRKSSSLFNAAPVSSTQSHSPHSSSSVQSITQVHQPDMSQNNTDTPLVSSGLKIRIRRDTAFSDVHTTKRKRSSKKNNLCSFRIVESWCDADAPGSELFRQYKKETSDVTSPVFTPTNGSLRVGDIVWAKLAGYPYWPSRISAIWARTAHQVSQATPLPSSEKKDKSPLAVLATPLDPNLASGYTARVDWLAWDQCSYLSCAKLYPFSEAYDRMYNPRTRVKGYAEAIRLAKRYVHDSNSSEYGANSETSDSFLFETSQSLPSLRTSEPRSTDSHISTNNFFPSSIDPPSSVRSTSSLKESCDNNAFTIDSCVSVPPTHSGQSICDSPILSSQTPLESSLNQSSQEAQFSTVSAGAHWAPLPQLDVAGLCEFASHVPTFSENEDDLDDSLTSHLQLDFNH